MTTFSRRGKGIAAGTLSLAVLITATLGTGVANAATPTAQDGLPPVSSMTPAEQAQIASYTRWTGKLESMSLPQSVVDSWAKIGFSLDIPASIAATNAYNDAHNTDYLILVAKNDIATFVANSPYASSIDPAHKAKTGASGLGFLANGGDGAANMTLPKFQTASPLQAGQISGDFALYPQVGLTTNDPSTLVPDQNAPAGQWVAGFIAPSSSNYAAGMAIPGATTATKTWLRDPYDVSAQRNADLALGGTQRGHNPATLVDCTTANAGACGVSLQPMAYGNLVNAANLDEGTMAVGETGFLTVVSTRHEVTPAATTEATAMTLASGTKVWFTPASLAAQGPTLTGGRPNFFDPAVALIPAGAGTGTSAFSPSLMNTTVKQDASGALTIGVDTHTAFADSPVSQSITPAAAAGTYTMTLTNADPRTNGVWLNQLGTAYAVGDSSYYPDGNTTITVTGNSNGVLTFNVAVGAIISGTPTVTVANAISTDIAGGMATDGYFAPSYLAHYILPAVAPTPTPTTPVVPKDTPTPAPAPTGDSGNQPVDPPTGDSGGRPFENMGDTSASEKVAPVAAADTTATKAEDGNWILVADIIAGGLALIGGLVLAIRKWARSGVKAIKAIKVRNTEQ